MPMDSIAVYIEPDLPIGSEQCYAAEVLLVTLGAQHRKIADLEESALYGVTLACVRDPVRPWPPKIYSSENSSPSTKSEKSSHDVSTTSRGLYWCCSHTLSHGTMR